MLFASVSDFLNEKATMCEYFSMLRKFIIWIVSFKSCVLIPEYLDPSTMNALLNMQNYIYIYLQYVLKVSSKNVYDVDTLIEAS